MIILAERMFVETKMADRIFCSVQYGFTRLLYKSIEYKNNIR